jgi:hypothetical protein
MEWNGMEWNGMEWNRMEWNGMEWNRTESNGIEWNKKVLVHTHTRAQYLPEYLIFTDRIQMASCPGRRTFR